MSENKNFIFNLPTVDELFDVTHGSYLGRIENIPTNVVKAFKGHPFKVKDDEEMERLVESIKERGVLNPILVRPKENGEFEIAAWATFSLAQAELLQMIDDRKIAFRPAVELSYLTEEEQYVQYY